MSFTPCFARAALLLVSGKWNGAMSLELGFGIDFCATRGVPFVIALRLQDIPLWYGREPFFDNRGWNPPQTDKQFLALVTACGA